MTIWMQKSASIQQSARRLKFADTESARGAWGRPSRRSRHLFNKTNKPSFYFDYYQRLLKWAGCMLCISCIHVYIILS